MWLGLHRWLSFFSFCLKSIRNSQRLCRILKSVVLDVATCPMSQEASVVINCGCFCILLIMLTQLNLKPKVNSIIRLTFRFWLTDEKIGYLHYFIWPGAEREKMCMVAKELGWIYPI